MDDSKLFGVAITILVVLFGLLWARQSLRRLFLVAVVMGISAGLRVGTSTGGIYPYELIFVLCGVLFLMRMPTAPTALSRRALIWFSLLAAWWVAGALINVLILKPDLHLVTSMGMGTDALQLKLLGHLALTILVCGIAFWAGGVLFNPDFHTSLFMSAIICGTTIVCLSTLFEWLKSTGGVVARYNFLPPTDLGQGGTSFMMLIGAACCLLLLLAQIGSPKVVGALLILHLLGIAVVQTRQGYLACLLYFAVLTPLFGVVLLNKRRKLGLLIAAPFLILVITAVAGQLLARSGFYESFISLTNSDVQDRVNKIRLIDSAKDIFEAHPIIGVGRGQFSLYSDIPMVVSGQSVYVATPHNGLFELLAETGILGTVFAYLFQFWLAWKLWNIYRGGYAPHARAVGGMAAFLVAVSFVTSFVQSNTMFPAPDQRDFVRQAVLVWLIAGFAAGARPMELDERCASETSRGIAVLAAAETSRGERR